MTGAQAANTVALAAARHHQLAAIGWDVERDGLIGGPRVRIVVGEERHATIDRALRLLGFGTASLETVTTDARGALEVTDLARVLAGRPTGPTIVCLQAGNVTDEINRATPKTQSALLEAMQENSVSAGGQTHPLEQPFYVLATMNPLEMEGTYPLPEAQLDRFFFKLRLGFPTADGLHEIIDRTTKQQEPHVDRVLGQGEVLEMRETARSVPVARHVQQYAIDLTLATHPETEAATEMVKRFVRFGSSPRGTQALILGGKVNALLNDRLHVACEDIRTVALNALRHRLLLNFDAEAEGVDSDAILKDVLQRVGEPRA